MATPPPLVSSCSWALPSTQRARSNSRAGLLLRPSPTDRPTDRPQASLVRSEGWPRHVRRSGLTALACAAMRGHTATVTELARLGAAVGTRDEASLSCLLHAP